MEKVIKPEQINYDLVNWKIQPSIWINYVLKIRFLEIGFIDLCKINEWVDGSKS